MKSEASGCLAPRPPACQWTEDKGKDKARHGDSRVEARQAWQVGLSRDERTADGLTGWRGLTQC